MLYVFIVRGGRLLRARVMMRRAVLTWWVRGIHRVHAGHTTRRAVRRHAIGRVVASLTIAVWHHCAHLARGWRRHGIAMASSASMRVSMAFKVAIGPSTSVRRGKGVGTSTTWRKWVLVVSVLLVGAATKRHQLIRRGGWTAWTAGALEGVEAWVGHHAGRIATRRRLLGNVSPLVVRVVWRGPRPWRAIGVIVVAVQTFRMDGLRPSPPRPRVVF